MLFFASCNTGCGFTPCTCSSNSATYKANINDYEIMRQDNYWSLHRNVTVLIAKFLCLLL